MDKLGRGVRVYSLLLRLYPRGHRDQYGQQMLQTVEDMLDHAPSTVDRMSVWARIMADLPLSVCKEHLEAMGENMQTLSSNHIKFGTIAALLAGLVNLGAFVGNKIIVAFGAMDSIWLISPLHGFLFPTLALLIVGVILWASRRSSQSAPISTGRMWLLATIASIAIMNIALFAFALATRKY